MSDLVKMLGNSKKEGWHLTLDQAQTLYDKGVIVKPTLNALKNHFIDKVLGPKMRELVKADGLESPNQISGLRYRLPKITVGGNQFKLSSVNKLWEKVKDNKPVTNASKYLIDDYRSRAAFDFSETSKRTADFYDDIEYLKNWRSRKLEKATHPNRIRKIEDEFDNKMRDLFEQNKRYLPTKNNKPIEYNYNDLDKYGWRPGKSRKDYLINQGRVYDQSQQETVAWANKIGMNVDSGHVMALGGMKISDAERQKYFIPKDELEPDPDGEGWILRGTNAGSNLAIEVAKFNRSKGNLSPRNIEDIMRINVAFRKSLSLLEYNLSDDKTFRQNTDYSAAVRSLMSHNPHIPMDQLISIGEDEILNKGIEPKFREKGSQKHITNELGIVNPEVSPVTTHKYDPGNMPQDGSISRFGKLSTVQQAIDTTKQVQLNQLTGKEEVKAWQARELAAQERDNKRIIEETNRPITALQDAAKDFGRHPLVNEATGGITGEIVTATEALEQWSKGDNIGAAINATKLITKDVNPLDLLPSTIEKMPTKPWHSKNRFLPSAS